MAKGRDAVVEYLRASEDDCLREQTAFAEIPSPDWRARERADHLARAWRAEGLDPQLDKVGNVVAVRSGSTPSQKRPPLILAAHIDSVFYDVTKISVKREGRVLRAPGICDNAAGVANLIMLARAMKRFSASTAGDVVFVGSVGEEGEGRLRGMRHFFKANAFSDARFVAIDGSGPGAVTRRALASWSPKIVVTGLGGHSYGNFGRPNPVHMLARFITKVTTLPADRATNTVYNATVIHGGTAVNVIPAEARMTLNLRSSDMGVLRGMKRQALAFLKEARDEEIAWATAERQLDVRWTALERPGGSTPEDDPLVVAAIEAMKNEGLDPAFDVKSTDANLPMSLGIPAICISCGGTAGNAHSIDEWHDVTGRTKELAALAALVFSVAG